MNTVRVLVLSAIVLATFAGIANAQPLAGSSHGDKITGSAYWPLKASQRHFDSARYYAQEFKTYVANSPKPEPSVVKDIKTEVGRYLEEGKKHLAQMKKDLAADKEVVAAIEGIEKELAAAVEHNAEMIACCEKETFDKVAGMACCTDLVKQLDKVHASHVALMKQLATKYPPKADVKK
jgi:hypothetical protein